MRHALFEIAAETGTRSIVAPLLLRVARARQGKKTREKKSARASNTFHTLCRSPELMDSSFSFESASAHVKGQFEKRDWNFSRRDSARSTLDKSFRLRIYVKRTSVNVTSRTWKTRLSRKRRGEGRHRSVPNYEFTSAKVRIADSNYNTLTTRNSPSIFENPAGPAAGVHGPE